MFLSIKFLKSSILSPISGTDTVFIWLLTNSLSTGLSSINTKESSPILISLALSKILFDFRFQFAFIVKKSSLCKTMLGCFNPSKAFSKSFFELIVNTIPISFISFIYFWKSSYASPIAVSLPIFIPFTPSSPITPPQRVLSKSRAIAFLFLPYIDFIILATLCAAYVIPSNDIAYL